MLRPPRLAVALTLGAIVSAGAAARFWALDFGLPHTQARPDETFIIDVALSFLRGDFWPPFFNYPRLYNYAVTLLYLVYWLFGLAMGRFATLADLVASWPVDWAPFFLLSRGLSAACGTLTIVVVYRLVRDLDGRRAGLASALFTSLAFLHVRDSHFGTTDVALTLLVAVAVQQLARTRPGRVGGADILAALSGGLATGTKYSAAIVVVPLLVSQAWHARAARPGAIGALAGRRLWLMAAAFAAGLLAGTPFVLFDFAAFWEAMRVIGPDVAAGHLPRVEIANGWWYHLSVSLRHGVGLPVLLLGVSGLALAVWREARRGSLLVSFPIAYFLVAGAVGDRPMRYVVPLVPFLCAGAGIAVARLVERLPARRDGWRTALATVLAVAAVAPSAWRVAQLDRLLGRRDTRVLVAEWILRHAEPGATVVYSGSIHGDVQFARDVAVRPWQWSGRDGAFLARGQAVEGRPDWILVQESPLPNTTQPIVEEWLRGGYQLATIIRGFDPAQRRNVYDRPDAFFLPVAGFAGIDRPGPNFYVYRRADGS